MTGIATNPIAISADPIRVLIIDDDAVDRRSVKRFLERDFLNYSLSYACTLADGKKTIEANEFDIVLLDFSLGDGYGIDLLPLCQSRSLPVVMITGSGSEELASAALRKGAADYLIKDGQCRYLRVLPMTINNVLIRRQLERDRNRLIIELQAALERIETLRGFIPICAWCKRVRTEEGEWEPIEQYLAERSLADFTHGLCPECYVREHEFLKRPDKDPRSTGGD